MSVPLLAGWNSAEGGYGGILGKDEPTVENSEKAIRKIYGEKADMILRLYSASSPEEVKQAAPLVMWIDVSSHVEAEQHAARYAFLDTLY